METQISLDEKIRSTFGKALLDALSETNKAGGKGRPGSPAQIPAAKILKEKRYNIMLVNLEGYPGAYNSLDAESLDQLQKDFYEIVEASAAAHRGSIVKNTESTCLITFESSTDVFRAGLKIESTVARYNKDNDPINTKIVINTDEIVSEEWGELFKKFMNRVIQKEKISHVHEKSEISEKPAAELPKISGKREPNLAALRSESASSGSGARVVSDSTAPLGESTTRTITEKRMAHAPRTPIKVVTHKRELPEGAQQFTPHFIHSNQPRKMEEGADWSHRLFLLVLTAIICGGGYLAIKSVGRRFTGRLEPLKAHLSESASISSAFIQSKFFSSGKAFSVLPASEPAPAAVEPASAAPTPIAAARPVAVPAAAVPLPVLPKQNAPLIISVIPQPQADAAVSAASPGLPVTNQEVPAGGPAAKPAPRVVSSVQRNQPADDGETNVEKIARYRSVIRAHPDSPDAHAAQVEIGKIRIEQGQTSLAKEVFNELLTKSPAPQTGILAESQYQLGVAYWKEKDFASAKWCFERVIKQYPQAAGPVKESQRMLAVVKQDLLHN